MVGGILTALFMQETIINRQFRASTTKQAELSRQVTEAKTANTALKQQLSKQQHQVIIRVTKPNGEQTETITTDTSTQVLTQLRQEITAKYEAQLAEKDRQYAEKIESLSIHKNPKRLDLFFGAMPTLNPTRRMTYVGGFNYSLWGPFTVGVTATSTGFVAPTIGVRF